MHFFLGLDVAKATLDCTLLNDKTGEVKHFSVDNKKQGFQTLEQIIKALPDQPLIALEPTATYHEACADYFSQAGFTVYLVHALYTRNYAKSLGIKTKTDKVDSLMLARYVAERHHQLKPYQPLSDELKVLRALNGRISALTEDIKRENLRLKSALVVPGSDEATSSILVMLDFLESQKESLEKRVIVHIEQSESLQHDYKLLLSIPGVGPVLARSLLLLFHTRRFTSASQAAAFIGIVPIHNESGTSIRHKSQISKAGDKQIRTTLYMAAMSAIQSNTIVAAHYQKLVTAGKPRKAAVIAAMRKLLHICFGVVRSQTPYDAGI